MAQPIPARLSPAEGRRFGLTVGGAFLAVAAVAWWRGREGALIVTGTLGTLLVVAGLLLPSHLGPVQRAWTAGAHALSKVTTPIFMSVMYFVVFTPAGLLIRAFGHRPIAPVRTRTSFWVPRGSKPQSDMHRQF